MADGNTFPTLDADSIVDTLAEYQIHIKLSQLRQPTSDFVFAIYSQIVQKVTGLTHASLNQPVDEACDSLNTSYHDIYRQSFAREVMAHHIARLAHASQMTDFSTRDLALPNAHRTRQALSAFINFLAHTQFASENVSNIRQDASAVRTELETLERQVRETRASMDKIRLKRAEEQSTAATLEKTFEDLLPQVMAGREKYAAIKDLIERIKSEREQVNRHKDAAGSDINKLQESIQTTQDRIVRSPERMRRNISLMNSTVAEGKRAIAQNENKVRDLQAKQAAFLNIEKEVRACVQQLQIVEKEIKDLTTTERQLVDGRDLFDRRTMEKNGLQLKKERFYQQRVNAQEKLERAKRQAADKRLASAQTQERLQQEYAELSVERRVNDREVEGIRKEAEAVEARMVDHLKISEAELNEMVGAYWTLRQQLDTYMAAVGNKLGFEDND